MNTVHYFEKQHYWVVLYMLWNLLSNPCSCAWCTVRPNKPKLLSLEQRKVYCWAEQGVWAAHAQKTRTPQWLSGKGFQKQIWGGGRLQGVWPFSDWLVGGNRAPGISIISLLVPTSLGSSAWAQHVVTILHLDGDLSSYRRTQRCGSDCYMYPLRRN